MFKRLLVLLLIAASAVAAYYGYERMQLVDTSFKVDWDNKSGPKSGFSYFLQISDNSDDAENFLKQILGEEIFGEVKRLYRKHVGLTRFMTGDVLEVTQRGSRVVSYDLHHYKNNSKGERISFVRDGDEFSKIENVPIELNVRTVVKYFAIKDSLSKDDPQFYEIAKERLVWDWGILDKLRPGDSIAFIVKGIFDKGILVKTYGILGFAVKSATLGEFSMTAFRDSIYGDYFLSGHSMLISPPGEFRTPIDSGRVTSYFGERHDPFNKKKKRFHSGVDILARLNTPVRAAESGRVIFADKKGGLGKAVVIDHGNGLRTVYGHLNKFMTVPGAEVRRGDIIAGAGSTGRSTAPHLHFTVLKDGKPVDPMQFTYERIWAAPFDISGEFRELSAARMMQLDSAMTRQRSFFIEEKGNGKRILVSN
ncbi:M23 family metallopeptidase [bacterium]|nr:M23 family metallopeptidase [bacterium]